LKKLGVTRLLGIEYNPNAGELARSRYGIEVRTGDLFSGNLPSGEFDGVIMRYVLEHVASPTQTLREVGRILCPGGRFFFSIPNPDSLDAKFYRENWLGYEIPRHFYNFPLKTLNNMLESSGFTLERIEFSIVPNDWIISAKYLLQSKGCPACLSERFSLENPFALALFFPVGVIAGMLHQSGRIRVTVRKLQT
jgi:SAM-dependent methyltransferase